MLGEMPKEKVVILKNRREVNRFVNQFGEKYGTRN